MSDFGLEADTGSSAENRTYDLDERVLSEAEDIIGYEDDDDDGYDGDGDDDDAIEKPDSDAADKEEEEEEEEEEDKKEEEEPSKKSANTRAEKRIRQLIKQQKEKESKVEALKQENLKMQQHMYRWQMDQQKRQAESDKQIALIEAENKRHARQQEIQEEANLDPVVRLQREAARSARESALAEIDPKLLELQAQIQQGKEERRREVLIQQRDERLKGYERQAHQAMNGLLDGVEARQSDFLKDELVSQILTYSAAGNILPNDAAKSFDKLAHKYVAAKQAARKRKNGKALAKSANTPKSIPNKRRSAKGGRKMPSYAELQKKGFPDALAYLEAQHED